MRYFILTLFFTIVFLATGANAQHRLNYTQAAQRMKLEGETYDKFIKAHREAELRIESFRVKYKGVPEEDIMEIRKLKIGLIYDMQQLLGKDKYAEYKELKEAAEKPD